MIADLHHKIADLEKKQKEPPTVEDIDKQIADLKKDKTALEKKALEKKP